MTVGFLPALSLTERVPVDGAGSYPVSDRARWRLSRWRGSQAFATAGAWQRRLAADACDEDALLRLLDEPAARIAERLAHPRTGHDGCSACTPGRPRTTGAPSGCRDGRSTTP